MEQDPHETAEIDLESDSKKTQDQGGRRKKADRRGRTSVGTFPERRWLRHRRDGGDRRSFPFFSPRQNRERRDAFQEKEPGDQEDNG
jgi:hypothetical protein